MFDGDLFLGRADFILSIAVAGEIKADGSNVYKGIEDALNQVAYKDDKQNQFFKLREGSDR
jgi:hypothetical protein